jgi:hypothetical protein
MGLPARPVAVLLVASFLCAAGTGCANALEAAGGATMGIGAGTILVGAQLPSSYDCDSSQTAQRRWCTYGDASGNHATNSPPSVPAMIAGGALVVAGAVLYVAGRLQRPPSSPHAQATPPPPHGADADPEETVLEK